MAVKGEEVARSIDAQVRDAVGRMVEEIRSSIDDVRIAVDQQLNAALQSVQADVKSFAVLPQIQKAVGDFEESLATVAPPAPAADAPRIKRAIQAVERGRSQVDVLNALLEQCLEFGSRAALLILRGETFSGWKGVGFTAHGGNDENVKRFNAAPGLIPEIDRVLRNEQVVQWDGANLSTRMGVGASSKAVLVPMVIKDKVAAAIYVDAVAEDESKLDVTALEIVVFSTGLLIDTLAIRKKSPSPTLNEGDTSGSPTAAQPAAAAPQAPARPAPPAAAPESRPAASPAPVASQISDATVAFSAADIRDAGAVARSGFATEFATPSVTPAPRPAAPPPPPPTPSSAAPPALDERPTTQYVPPAGVGRGAALQTPQGEDAKKHDEARRFARLLVSEIKLYNEAKVDQGRKNRDLYERLKEDIDRSRQMYDERIGEDIRKASNYFYEELVRVLADGNADALGL